MIRLEPLLPLWALIPLFTGMLALAVVLWVRRPRQRSAWLRRTLMILMLLVIALRPVTPTDGEQTERMNANVFFVVDRTGSMNAEDYDGSEPRLEGVKADMLRIMEMTAGSRYAILSFDSTATQQLPLTTDAGAAEAWIDTVETEPTAYSRGSNVDRPLRTLVNEIADTREEDPDSSVLVYVLSDGENTDGEESESFSPLASQIDGGAVLGYGTPEGGPMQVQGGEADGEYITDADGSQGISSIDETQLEALAAQMGVPYLHRTDPAEPLEGTMEGVTLSPVPVDSTRTATSFRDWYWIAAIPLAGLMIWELGATTVRLPRRLDRHDIPGAQR